MGVQVAQLGEQQVQGCTARINHLEADLTRRADAWKQHQDNHTAALSDMTAHIAALRSQLNDSSNSASSGDVTQELAELGARVAELQTAVAAQKPPLDSKLEEAVAVWRTEMRQMQSTHESEQSAMRSSLASVQQELGALKADLTQAKSRQAAHSAPDAAISKLEHDVGALSAGLHQMQAAALSAGTARVEQDLVSVKAQMTELHGEQAAQEEVYSGVQQDMAALTTRVAQLDKTHVARQSLDRQQEQTEQLRSEMAACREAESQTQAAVSKHADLISRLEERVAAECHAVHAQVACDVQVRQC